MMVTVAEAVIIVNRSKSTVYQWIADGRLQAVRGTDGIRRIDGRALLNVEADTTPGRPPTTDRCPTCGHELGGAQ